ERTSNCPRNDVWNVCRRTVTFGAGERHEDTGLVRRVVVSAELLIRGHDLTVANAFFSGPGEPFPCGPDDMELVIQLALHDDSLATIELRGGEKHPARVRVDA